MSTARLLEHLMHTMQVEEAMYEHMQPVPHTQAGKSDMYNMW